MKHLSKYRIFEKKKSKRKIGSFAKHCMNLGYSGAKKGRCFGKKKPTSVVMDYDKDYYYDKKNEAVDYQKLETEVYPIIDTLNDIFLELTDDNFDIKEKRFRVKIQPCGPLYNYNDKLSILIEILKPEGFLRKDVYPIMDRVDEYLTSEGYCKYGVDKFSGYAYSSVYRYGRIWHRHRNSGIGGSAPAE